MSSAETATHHDHAPVGHTAPVSDFMGVKRDPHATRLGEFLKACIKFGASDLIIKTDQPPKLRMRGALKPLDTRPVTAQDWQEIIKVTLDEDQLKDLAHYGSVDFAYDYDESRPLPHEPVQGPWPHLAGGPSDYQQHPSVREAAPSRGDGQDRVATPGDRAAQRRDGLGQVDDDRLDDRLREPAQPVHIVTIEDPIEYIFHDKKATINQREIGIDVLDFKIALKALVRENPDIVLIGEMRDKDTFAAALNAAETGHLVYGTIHASSTTQTFSRIYGLFETEEIEQVRRMLAYQMRAFVYQKLLPTLHEHIPRIPGIEILINDAVVQKHILEEREGERAST